MEELQGNGQGRFKFCSALASPFLCPTLAAVQNCAPPLMRVLERQLLLDVNVNVDVDMDVVWWTPALLISHSHTYVRTFVWGQSPKTTALL